eukprot:TRINITY_DN3349_c0_g1_i1.p1 TRINITY_DN3349_c0_g1~~TRINITY_DN3349_c0_g1_i1.p1  ORF type:complete len:389 (-),score=34.94 TRINITY_DN3349_c0_g1_i1:227-1393(-)
MDSLSKCGLCSTSYVERTPKILLCGHTWCSFCLDSKQRNGNRVTCPNQKCAKIITPLPKEGASGLPTNIALKELAAQLEEQIEVNCSFQCPEHPTKKVDFFCLSCISPICSFCTKEAHKHHEFEVLESAFEPQRKMVSSQVGMIKVILGQVDKKIDDMKNTVSSLESDKQTTERHLREFFNKIREWIKKRETELLEDLHSSTQKIFKDLATSQENLSTLLISTRQGLHIIDTHLEKINPNYPNNNTPLSQLEFLKSTKMYYDMLAKQWYQRRVLFFFFFFFFFLGVSFFFLLTFLPTANRKPFGLLSLRIGRSVLVLTVIPNIDSYLWIVCYWKDTRRLWGLGLSYSRLCFPALFGAPLVARCHPPLHTLFRSLLPLLSPYLSLCSWY